MIVELREYHIHTGRLPDFLRIYETEGLALQREILGNMLGFFTVEVGEPSTVVHMWGYESYAERERRRAELMAHEDWQAYLAKIQPLIHTQRNRILVPTSFSPIG